MTDWLTPEEVATYLRVTRRTLYRWMEQGRLPWYELDPGGRVGSSARILTDHFDRESDPANETKLITRATKRAGRF